MNYSIRYYGYQEIKSLKVSKFQGFKVPRFQESKIPRCQCSNVPRFQDSRILNFSIPHETCLKKGLWMFYFIFKICWYIHIHKKGFLRAQNKRQPWKPRISGLESVNFGFDRCPVKQKNAISILDIVFKYFQ